MWRERSPAWASVPALVALAAAGARWLAQGAGNVYSDLGRRFYVPDPDLGWRVSADAPIFLGLDALGVLAGLAVGVALAGLVLGRLERARGRRLRPLRLALWVVAGAGLVVPLVAFASGGAPEGGQERLPQGLAIASPTSLEPGAGLERPAGRWRVVDHPGSRVVVSISAGGERFDGSFARPSGHWQGDPRDLAQPMTAHVEVAAARIDTGVTLRSEHAAELLEAAKHPTVSLDLLGLDGARRVDGAIAFAGRGTLTVMGRPVAVPITGTLRAPDAEAERRLGVGSALLLSADTALDLRQTPLAPRAKDFSDPMIGVHADLVLVRDPPQSKE